MPAETLEPVYDEVVDHARALLTLMIRTEADPLQRLVSSCALAHLDSCVPARALIEPAGSPNRGASLHREAVDSLIRLVRDITDPADRTRGTLALQELTTPLSGPTAGLDGGDR